MLRGIAAQLREAHDLDAIYVIGPGHGGPAVVPPGERPALVVLDDCQWADELTIKLIGQWFASRHHSSPAGNHAFLVASFRTEEVSNDHPLRKLTPTLHLNLDPLGPDDVRRLAESMAGPLPDEAVNVVVGASEGCRQ